MNAMLHETFLFLGQLWQLFEVSQILEFLRYLDCYLSIDNENPFDFFFGFMTRGTTSIFP